MESNITTCTEFTHRATLTLAILFLRILNQLSCGLCLNVQLVKYRQINVLLTAEYNLECLIVEVDIGPKEFRNYCTCIKRIMSEDNGVCFIAKSSCELMFRC